MIGNLNLLNPISPHGTPVSTAFSLLLTISSPWLGYRIAFPCPCPINFPVPTNWIPFRSITSPKALCHPCAISTLTATLNPKPQISVSVVFFITPMPLQFYLVSCAVGVKTPHKTLHNPHITLTEHNPMSSSQGDIYIYIGF